MYKPKSSLILYFVIFPVTYRWVQNVTCLFICYSFFYLSHIAGILHIFESSPQYGCYIANVTIYPLISKLHNHVAAREFHKIVSTFTVSRSQQPISSKT